MEEVNEEIKNCLATNSNANMTTQNLWDAAKVVLRGKFIAIQLLPKETRKRLTRQPNFTPKTTGKRRTTPTTTKLAEGKK